MKDEMITHAKAIGDNVQQESKGRVGRSGQRQNRVSRERKKQAKEKKDREKSHTKGQKNYQKNYQKQQSVDHNSDCAKFNLSFSLLDEDMNFYLKIHIKRIERYRIYPKISCPLQSSQQ